MGSPFLEGLQAGQQKQQSSALAQLQQAYLGQQIQGAQQSQLEKQKADQLAAQTQQYKQMYAGSQAVINSDDPKSTVEALFPDIVQMHEQKFGPGSWQTVTPDQVKGEAAQLRDHSAMQLGIAQPAKLITQVRSDGSHIQIDPTTGKETESVKADHRTVNWKDTGTMLVPVYNDTGERVPGLQPMAKTDVATTKPPSGYRAKPDGTLEAIPGGPADKNGAAGLGGRESVMFQRVMNSANSATEALKNISELPVGASTGVFGVGASPGASIFSSGKGALMNALSSQEVQDYNTMLAGVSRNLSTIETAGLAPNGSLTHSMDAIQLREGDSNLTKLRKLAEMRQIIVKGIETNTSNPKLPKDQKDLVNGIIDQVKTAIPFTQHDITELQRRQNKNPSTTLQDLMKEQGLAPATPQAAPQVQPQTQPQALAPGTYQHPSGAVVVIH